MSLQMEGPISHVTNTAEREPNISMMYEECRASRTSRVLMEGFREDMTRAVGPVPIHEIVTLRDNAFDRGGIGKIWFDQVHSLKDSKTINIAAKFVGPIDKLSELEFHRLVLEARAGIELYKGIHAQKQPSGKPFEHQGPSPFIVPRLLSMEYIGDEGIAPFQDMTRRNIMMVFETINGDDLTLRVSGGVDFFDDRLDPFAMEERMPTHEDALNIKEWKLFKMLKYFNFYYDGAQLSTGRRTYVKDEQQEPFTFEEAMEVKDLFYKDLNIAVAYLGLKLTRVLQEVHEQGKVHQDLKPQNIMVDTRGRVRLIDFGFVQNLDELNLTPSNQRVGTPPYWPLEYIRTGETTVQTEMWPVACILFELLTGRKVVDNFSSPGELIDQLQQLRVSGEESIFEDFEARIHPELLAILQTALQNREEDRFDSMQQFSLALEDFLSYSGGNKGKRLITELEFNK